MPVLHVAIQMRPGAKILETARVRARVVVSLMVSYTPPPLLARWVTMLWCLGFSYFSLCGW